MNWRDWLLWSFVATLALTSVMAGSQGLAPHPDESPLHAGHDVHPQPGPGQGDRLRMSIC